MTRIPFLFVVNLNILFYQMAAGVDGQILEAVASAVDQDTRLRAVFLGYCSLKLDLLHQKNLFIST